MSAYFNKKVNRKIMFIMSLLLSIIIFLLSVIRIYGSTGMEKGKGRSYLFYF